MDASGTLPTGGCPKTPISGSAKSHPHRALVRSGTYSASSIDYASKHEPKTCSSRDGHHARRDLHVRLHASSARRRSSRPKTNTRRRRTCSSDARRPRRFSNSFRFCSDDGVDDYVERVGAAPRRRIPAEFQHPEFRYSFDVVNVSDINAFALPGGPMFRQPRHDRGREERGRNRRRARARNQPRRAAPRNGTGQQAHQYRGRLGPRADRGRDPRRNRLARLFRWAASSVSARRS